MDRQPVPGADGGGAGRRRAGDVGGRRRRRPLSLAAGWLLVGVPVGVVVVSLPGSLIILAFGGGLFLFPTIAAGVVLLRGSRGAPVAGVLVATAMAALLLHATTWAGDLKHAWFFWPLMAYAAVTGALSLAAALLERPAGGRLPVGLVVALLALAAASLWWIAAAG